MNTNNKLNKANSYRLSQELLRNKALKKGVNLVAPETIFLSKGPKCTCCWQKFLLPNYFFPQKQQNLF